MIMWCRCTHTKQHAHSPTNPHTQRNMFVHHVSTWSPCCKDSKNGKRSWHLARGCARNYLWVDKLPVHGSPVKMIVMFQHQHNTINKSDCANSSSETRMFLFTESYTVLCANSAVWNLQHGICVPTTAYTCSNLTYYEANVLDCN